jgi:2-oxoglutarate dehydrogenase E2 component (dihydrolipoamide succinyltransferase)
MFGSLTGTPIINQPQLAVLALGAIRKIASVVETDFGDAIAIRKKMVVSLSYDHRVINGATGGKFIARLKEVIENWEENNNI